MNVIDFGKGEIAGSNLSDEWRAEMVDSDSVIVKAMAGGYGDGQVMVQGIADYRYLWRGGVTRGQYTGYWHLRPGTPGKLGPGTPGHLGHKGKQPWLSG